MKNYEVLKKDEMFMIWERTEEQYIYSVPNYERAKKLVKTLNQGGGFNGDTPSFFTKRLSTY